MADPMPDARLDEITALADAATPGPWEVMPSKRHVSSDVVWHRPGSVTHSPVAEVDPDHPDAEAIVRFIAAARTAVPELAAEVRRLRAELDETRRLVAAWLYAANSGRDTDPGSLQGAFMLSDRDLAPELDAIEAAREA